MSSTDTKGRKPSSIVTEAQAQKPIRWVTGWYKAAHGRWARKFNDADGAEGWRVGPRWEKD